MNEFEPVTSVEQLRAVLATVEPRYRLSASVSHIAGFGGPDYGGMISLLNDLRRHPEEAASSAAAHAEWAGADSVARRQLGQAGKRRLIDRYLGWPQIHRLPQR